MNWYKKNIANESIGQLPPYSGVAYHATGIDFDSFDLKHALDSEGMKLGEGYGPNKFYFAKEKSHAFPKVTGSFPNLYGQNPKILTVYLDVKKPYDGKIYAENLRSLTNMTSRQEAIAKLDMELKSQGFDAIEDDWQIAVFDPRSIQIIEKEPFIEPPLGEAYELV